MARQGKLAYTIRTGLEVIEGNKRKGKNADCEIDFLDELYFRKPIRQHVKEFGGILAAICLFITAFRIYKGSPLFGSACFVAVALVALILGYRFPRLLHPVWKGAMAVAERIGAVVTFIIVSIAWCTVTVPLAIILRIMKKDLMDMSFGADVESYWEDRTDKENDVKLIERQY